MINTCIQRLFGVAAISIGMLFAFAPRSHAVNIYYDVTLNVASLVSNSNGPFSVDFQLSTGAETGNSDNTVRISNFAFTSGSATAITYTFGGETGSLGQAITLVNSNAQDNEFAESFSAGTTSISFEVQQSTYTNQPFDDLFDISILDGSLNSIPTTDPNDGNTLLYSDINTGQSEGNIASTIQTYSSTSGGEAPGVTVTLAVPEPGTYATVLLGAAALVTFGARRRRLSRGA
jgi:hypothetical protein